MKSRFLCLAVLTLALGAVHASAVVLRVPADQPTIQAAVDAANPNDEIEIARGTYTEGVVVADKTSLTLRGKGRVVVDGQNVRVPLSILGSSGIRVEKLRFENSVADNLLIEGSSDVTIQKCRIRGGALDGILARDSSGLLIEGNKIEDVGLDGIGLSDDQLLPVVDSIARKNKILRPAQDGIEVEGDRNRLEHNKILEALDDGLDVDGDDNVVVGNKSVRSGDEGVEVEGDRNRFESNKVILSADDGFDVEGRDNEFVANQVKRSADDGIEVESNDDGVPSTGNLFERNNVKASGADGFHVFAGENVFRENKAKRSQGFDLNDESQTDTNLYEGNRFGTEQTL